MTDKKNQTLGILGGLGPMSTAYFYEMIIAHTKAECDQDHIDTVISGRATTPDRTRYIVGASDENPIDVMIEDAKRLAAFGADLIAIPCNTAHYFYDRISEISSVPVLNIIYETVHYALRCGCRKIGILATDGTLSTQTYQKMGEQLGVTCVAPDAERQKTVMSLIYESIKCGEAVDLDTFLTVADSLFSLGCERVVLGCTELSLIKKQYGVDDRFIDSLEVLACRSIRACGKETVGFSESFEVISCG